MLQLLRGAAPVCRDPGHDMVDAVRVPARHAEYEALGDGFMLPQRLLDGCRGHLPTCHVDLVIGAATQIDDPVLDLGEVGGLKAASMQCVSRLWPIRFADSPAPHHKGAVPVDRYLHVLHGPAHGRLVHTGSLCCVVGYAAAFGGTLEVVNFDPMLLEDGALQSERERGARRNCQAHVP